MKHQELAFPGRDLLLPGIEWCVLSRSGLEHEGLLPGVEELDIARALGGLDVVHAAQIIVGVGVDLMAVAPGVDIGP